LHQLQKFLEQRRAIQLPEAIADPEMFVVVQNRQEDMKVPPGSTHDDAKTAALHTKINNILIKMNACFIRYLLFTETGSQFPALIRVVNRW
jgi:hypothetical protein